MFYYEQKNGYCILSNDIPPPLFVMSNNKKEPIPYLSLSTPCTLVGMTITPNYLNSVVLEEYQEKIAEYCTRIALCPLLL